MKDNERGERRNFLRRQLVRAAWASTFFAVIYAAAKSTSASNKRPRAKVPAQAGRASSLPPAFTQENRRRAYKSWNSKYGGIDDETLILMGEAHLVDITVHSGAFSAESYHVTGSFCHLDFYLHKKDPSIVPMFRDLVGKSYDCEKQRISIDLHSIAQKARAYDLKRTVRAMEPTGFVFHESRCGSTLVANSLIAMDPERNRVYSESGPPITAAKEVMKEQKSRDSLELLRDVIYMMGRTNDPDEERLFFKIQSIGSKSIAAFQAAFPDTPWVFVYRDPVQVMMSHLKYKEKDRAVCLRSKRAPPPDLKDLVKRHGGPERIRGLSNEEFCAAHLATLCESAFNAYESSSTGALVNYEDLPGVLMDTIIPQHFLDGPLDEDARTRILKINEKYSKARSEGMEWVEDSKRKEEDARPEIRSACAKYLEPVYKKLKWSSNK